MPDPEHRCPYCERTFDTSDALDTHVTTGHPEALLGVVMPDNRLEGP